MSHTHNTQKFIQTFSVISSVMHCEDVIHCENHLIIPT